MLEDTKLIIIFGFNGQPCKMTKMPLPFHPFLLRVLLVLDSSLSETPGVGSRPLDPPGWGLFNPAVVGFG